MDLESNANNTQNTVSDDENDDDNEADINEINARLQQLMKNHVLYFFLKFL